MAYVVFFLIGTVVNGLVIGGLVWANGGPLMSPGDLVPVMTAGSPADAWRVAQAVAAYPTGSAFLTWAIVWVVYLICLLAGHRLRKRRNRVYDDTGRSE